MLGSRTVTSFPSRASPPPSGPHPREIPASCTPPAAGSQPWSKSNPAAHDMPATARRVLICQVPGPCGKGFWPRSSEADSTSQPKPGGQGRLPCGAGLSLPASRTASAAWASHGHGPPSRSGQSSESRVARHQPGRTPQEGLASLVQTPHCLLPLTTGVKPPPQLWTHPNSLLRFTSYIYFFISYRV